MRLGGAEYRPFILGHPMLARRLVAACPLPDALFVDVLAPENLAFFRLVNAGNHLAFGEMVMPAWAQLDCATLPSAMIGFARPKEELDPALWELLLSSVRERFGELAAREAEAFRGPIPVSEYCALPSFEPGAVVGFSLYSLVAGLGLGVRSKALALRCYGAVRQVGVTQYNSPALHTHCAFGPLEILSARAAPHSRPNDTFVYGVDVSDTAHLDALISEGSRPEAPEPADVYLPLAPTGMPERVEALQRERGRLALVWPGVVERDGGRALALRVLGETAAR